MRGRKLRALLGRGVLLVVALGVLSPSAAAKRPTVAVGEVSARIPGADPATEQAFRVLVAREIERLRLEGSRRDEAYVFSASLVRLEAKESRDGARATCVVSGILRRAGTGAIVAMMQGRGSAEDDRTALQAVRVRAMEAAVHGAVRRVPEAF